MVKGARRQMLRCRETICITGGVGYDHSRVGRHLSIASSLASKRLAVREWPRQAITNPSRSTARVIWARVYLFGIMRLCLSKRTFCPAQCLPDSEDQHHVEAADTAYNLDVFRTDVEESTCAAGRPLIAKMRVGAAKRRREMTALNS